MTLEATSTQFKEVGYSYASRPTNKKETLNTSVPDTVDIPLRVAAQTKLKPTGAIVQATRLLPPKTNLKSSSLFYPRRTKSTRPSLSEQLATIGKDAVSITDSLTRTKSCTDSNLFSTPSQQFIVGRIACKFPSPIHFSLDKCTYAFHHPYVNKEIQMHMYYCDMHNRAWKKGRRLLTFKVYRALEQFGTDYDPNCTHHLVQIEFASQSDAKRVQGLLQQHRAI